MIAEVPNVELGDSKLGDSELSDSEFISQFEDLSLDPKRFNHLGHLRIAWLYLGLYELSEANERVCSGIKSYAESLGAKDKFNLTITNSLVKIMAKRFVQKQSWKDFLSNNSDLVNDALDVLSGYFSEALLFSDKAKTSLIDPDRKDI